MCSEVTPATTASAEARASARRRCVPWELLRLWAAAALIGGAYLALRRPSNRCGTVAVLLGVVFASWWISAFAWQQAGGFRQFLPLVLVYLLRPLLFWLVLAFPIGRLDR